MYKKRRHGWVARQWRPVKVRMVQRLVEHRLISRPVASSALERQHRHDQVWICDESECIDKYKKIADDMREAFELDLH